MLLNASWPLYQNAGRNCIAGEGALPLHFGWAACSVVEMALWWRWRGRGWGAGTGWWLLPVRWTVNTGFYLFLETAFQWSFSLTDGSGVGKDASRASRQVPKLAV